MPDYDIGQSQAKIAKFEQKIQEKNKVLTKKFSFKNAKKKAVLTKVKELAKIKDNEESLKINNGFIIENKSDEEILIDSENDVGNYLLSNLQNCKIIILNLLNALTISNVKNSVIYTAPINGSVFVDSCQKIILHTASRQVRIHSTNQSDFYLFTLSNPVIEDSNSLRFSSYDNWNENISKWMNLCNFDFKNSKWDQIQDFNWPKANSPNWNFL